jgi:pimeloyl-ACP methyl ester carboxylesterase
MYSTLRVLFAFTGVAMSTLTMAASERLFCPNLHLNAEIVSEDTTIASDTPGIELFVRSKRLAIFNEFTERTVLLYVHGATYPAETAFDLRLDGFSWMDYIVCHGYEAYLVDLRGYGRSTRPSEMSAPALENPPIVTTDVAIRDVSSAVDYILAKRAIPRLNLLGWSWGTAIMGGYTAEHNDKVSKLVLYAPLWLREKPAPIPPDEQLGAYRTVSKDAAKKRWLNGVTDVQQPGLIPEGWFELWQEATWATDPQAAESGLLRAPNGVMKDVRDYWSAGKPSYDAAKIRVPTMLAHAEWDADTPTYMALELQKQLVNAGQVRLLQIPEGTHSVIMEKNRMQLFKEVQDFLDERVK